MVVAVHVQNQIHQVITNVMVVVVLPAVVVVVLVDHDHQQIIKQIA